MTSSADSTTTTPPNLAEDKKKPGSATNAYPANIPPTTKVVRNTTYGTPSRLSVQQEGTNVSTFRPLPAMLAVPADIVTPGLSPEAIVTYLAIASRTQKEGYATLANVEQVTGFSEKVSCDAIAELLYRGWVYNPPLWLDHDTGRLHDSKVNERGVKLGDRNVLHVASAYPDGFKSWKAGA